MKSLGDPENGNNGQVLGELGVLFVVLSLCNGKLHGLSEVMAIVVCKARSS